MALDTVCVAALARELRELLVGCRVDKIQQPERDEILLSMHGRSGGRRVLLSANPSGPRVQVTAAARENPAAPPMFCMLLRKHLLGGRLSELRQQNGDRILTLEFECADEMGEPCRKSLTAELMGRYSNVILIDAEGRIIDCLKRVDAEMSPVRQVLPGLFYRTPPALEKRAPADSAEGVAAALFAQAPDDRQVCQFLLDRFAWISPLVGRELAFRAVGDVSARFGELPADGRRRLAAEVGRLAAEVLAGRTQPWMLLERRTDAAGREIEKPADFCYFPIRQYGDTRRLARYGSFSELLDAFYSARESAARAVQRVQAVIKPVQAARDKLQKKLAAQRAELSSAADRDRLRRCGDLLTAGLHLVERGASEVSLPDYYEEGTPAVRVKLDPRLSPQQNAQQYYKQYARAKNAEHMLKEWIAQGERELAYLESVLDELSRASGAEELSEIRQELSQNGYASQKWADSAAPRGKKKAQSALAPREYRSTSGFPIYAGRNNRQNELLTLKSAAKSDVWLHTQKIPGSHVVIDCGGRQPDDRTITEAAVIAAWHSRARSSSNVPVDYTQVRHVKKQPGGKPGMVIYTDYRTAYVDPDEALAESLRADRNDR